MSGYYDDNPEDYPLGNFAYDYGYGYCPDCGYPLHNWGAASGGDGDIYDEIGCDFCQEVKREEHAEYCTCEMCL